jgi:hypothetical protein
LPILHLTNFDFPWVSVHKSREKPKTFGSPWVRSPTRTGSNPTRIKEVSPNPHVIGKVVVAHAFMKLKKNNTPSVLVLKARSQKLFVP